jgi:hypothetical protein
LLTKPPHNQVHQTLNTANQPLKNLTLTTAPVLLTNPDPQLTTSSNLDPPKHTASRVPMQKHIPRRQKQIPVPGQQRHTLGTLGARQQRRKRAGVVQQEQGMGTQQVLQQQRGRLDFAGGILDPFVWGLGWRGGAAAAFAGWWGWSTGCGSSSSSFAWWQGQTGEVDGLGGFVS